MTFIYALCDPHNGEIRYVGKADDTERRLKAHLQDRASCHKTNWIKSLLADFVKPFLVRLEECSKEEWQEREAYWINFLRTNGAKLVNGTNGGDGTLGRQFSQETIAKLSAAHKGKPLSPERRAKLLAANIGKKASAETRAKQSLAHKGQPRSAAYRANISAGQKGKTMSAEMCAKMRAIKFGTKHSPETRAKMSLARKRFLEKEVSHNG